MAEITFHALYSSKRDCEMNGHYATNIRELPKNGRVKVRIQMLKRPSTKWYSITTGRSARVSGPEKLAKKLGHNDFKAINGWLYR
jgi:hypothetical protein